MVVVTLLDLLNEEHPYLIYDRDERLSVQCRKHLEVPKKVAKKYKKILSLPVAVNAHEREAILMVDNRKKKADRQLLKVMEMFHALD